MNDQRPFLVIGAGGLLGGALVRELSGRGTPVATATVPWSDSDGTVSAIQAAVRLAYEQWGRDWTFAWCAGAGVTGTTREALAMELKTLTRVVEALVDDHGTCPARAFYASSAGGVYAGAEAPPFTEETTPRPLAPYGEAKLAAESAFARLTHGGTTVLVGRISNLYGPGQDMSKDQGLISRLCRSFLVREPVGVYVSLDTIRDYLFVDDCAAMVVDAMAALTADQGTHGTVVTKIIAAQQSASIASLLGQCRAVFGRPVLVRMASSPQANQQARDLRFASRVLTQVDRRPLVSLPHGIHATLEDQRAHLRRPKGD